MMDNLKINPEFEYLIPSMLDEEFELLEKNIISEGEIYTPLFVWNGYIIDGHHRYKILCEHQNIKYKVIEKEFKNKYEAISWMCNNQLGRRNLTPENKKYLIGKRYDAEKKSNGTSDGFRGNQYKELVGSQNGNLPKNKQKTCERIAKETGTSKNYVLRADEFAKGVDAAEEVVPGIKKEILSGQIKKSAQEIAAISKAPVEERKTLTENLRIIPPKKQTSKKTMGEIKNIVSGLHDTEKTVSDESVIESLEGTIDMFIETCESIFVDHPQILVKEDLYQEVRQILDKAIQYINKIKKGV